MPTCTWRGIKQGVEYAFEIGTDGCLQNAGQAPEGPFQLFRMGCD